MANMAIHGSHNASLAVENDGKLVCVIEFERWISYKNSGYTSFYPILSLADFIVYEMLDYVKEHFGISEYENCFIQDAEPSFFNKAPVKNFVDHNHIGTHHALHAYGTFYQSNFDKAIILSYDGGAPDGWYHIYRLERGKRAELIGELKWDLGSNYGYVGSVCSEIQNRKKCNLTYAGKVMGLQSYGNVRPEWKEALIPFYKHTPFWQDCDNRLRKIVTDDLGLTLNENFQLAGQDSYDLVATSQSLFEDIVFQHFDPVVEAHPDWPICVTGGCALNILVNTKMKERYNRPIFVAPNSNDTGLAIGLLAGHVCPKEPWDVTYAGIHLLDRWMLMRYVDVKRGVKANLDHIIDELANDVIFGFVQGRSEHGPRALGNRSIICSPIGEHVKDRLNARVKHREWYRPFAPIVRLEDVSEYFEFEGESRWMNFCPRVREKYLTMLPAITHVDNTARVQTVTQEQNPLMYELITKFKEKTGIGVLLNTSFNVDGKPILSTIAEAFQVFESTELDRLYIEGYYFTK